MTRPPQVLCQRARGLITLGRCTLEVLEWMSVGARRLEPGRLSDAARAETGCGTCVCNPALDAEESESTGADDPGAGQ